MRDDPHVSTLAVVRRNPLIPKRDLLLFDEIYVLDLDTQLEAMNEPDRANVLYLIEQGVVKSADMKVEPVWKDDVPLAPWGRIKGHQQRERFLRIGDFVFRVEVENYTSWFLELLLRAPMPPGAERFVAATISKKMGSLGHCTFLIDKERNTNVKSAFSGQILVPFRVRGRIGSFKLGPLPGLMVRGYWVAERGETEVEDDPTEWAIFEAVIESLPVPGELVPIEAILEFKNRAAERLRLERLSRWIQQTLLEGTKSPRQLRLEMEDLIEEYEAEMRAQRMVVAHERVRILIGLPLGLLRALVGSFKR